LKAAYLPLNLIGIREGSAHPTQQLAVCQSQLWAVSISYYPSTKILPLDHKQFWSRGNDSLQNWFVAPRRDADHRYAANIYLSSEVLSGFKNCKNSHSGESTGENYVFSLANNTY
jgi:hypothetical protein